MSEKPYTRPGSLGEKRLRKLLIIPKKRRLPPFEIQILEASWETGNNYFEDFYAFFGLVSDATLGVEVVKDTEHPWKDGPAPGFRGSSTLPSGEKSAFHLSGPS